MQGISIRAVAGMAAILALAGCVSTQQPDGTTKKEFTLAPLFAPKQESVMPEFAGTTPMGMDVSAPIAPAAAPARISTGKAAGAGSVGTTAGDGAGIISSKAKAQLQQALSCVAAGKNFTQAEALLRQIGWTSSQGADPVELPEPLRVYGHNVHMIAIVRDGADQIYRSYMAGVTQKQLAKSAQLKLAEDGKTYRRSAKLGQLEAGTDGEDTTLTCTVKVAPTAQ